MSTERKSYKRKEKLLFYSRKSFHSQIFATLIALRNHKTICILQISNLGMPY
jgi:hypothetical protein